MGTYRHGAYALEQATSIVPPRRVESSLPVVFGLAPVQKLAKAKVHEPVLISSYAEFVQTLGWDDDLETYGLCGFAKAYFSLYGVTPAVFVNVLDPAAHVTAQPAAPATFDADGMISLGRHGITGLSVKSADDVTTYQAGADYVLDAATGVISRKEGGSIPAGATVKVGYSYVDPAKAVAADVIGGIDAGTGKKEGLELLSEIFPRYRLVPALVAAPGFSQEPAVAIVMAAKCEAINGHFKALAVADLPESVARYSDAPGYKAQQNLMDERLILCWPPKLTLGENVYWQSCHVAALMGRVDEQNEGVPFESPSNKRYEASAATLGATEIWLGLDEANYLNGQGIVTALNFVGGLKCWGNRTACYPDVTDVKDAFIPVKRMFAWICNTLVLTAWQRLDAPIRRRTIETIVDSFNIWLNGLTAREMILGGRVEFRKDENPVTDLMDGVLRFHVYVTPPSPAREMDFLVEYDPDYLQTLFG